ncbi:tetraacyldisaccharide 4'-kinase [Larsenimonas rhizosphaerae]|uniref:Tetraacyldisaccharide 4'-kinase n=1 Tax=Larsenimonas rhizosphaerae TaxID=2944682 RepID=A0AA41ZFH5_9GAMM|nr:tetraacyldisaccharide 4'-kinase [Larsenimonas rhizosphaerae]MCM2130976.1 tetraacyldisaccharide 4'-kinase [Larsenimonas rhizosphaerae]MCX2523681.1 tetraacyldisaccharide 4'-kinase [Larsenimonas rhizosphaerae]
MKRLEQAWYNGSAWPLMLTPLEALYKRAVARRHQQFRAGSKTIWEGSVPVIVVGNITLGGTGKSPLVAWLVRWLQQQGWHPGIISRGYGGHAPRYPLYVDESTDPAHAGDEPVMLAQQTGLPVAVDPDRPRAARKLIAAGCDILVSDDGLQHLYLGRDIELVVVDGQKGFGNQHCLPAGPLREPLTRLATVDAVITNGELDCRVDASEYAMTLVPSAWRHLSDGVCYPVDARPFSGKVHATAGIGNPQRFFRTLESLGVEFDRHPLADHHRFTAEDLKFADNRPVVMTAKDAVKCRRFANERCWSLDVEAHPEPALIDYLRQRLAQL